MLRAYLLCFFITGLHICPKAQEKGKTYAVVIGISNYESKAIPPLAFADNDARLFARYLQTDAGGNVPSSQIKLLVNDSATLAAVYNALDWLKEVCSNDDVAYIYFSGHGDVETQDLSHTLGYLLAYNTPPNNYRNNAIAITDLNADGNYLTLQKKAKVVLITDACRSGKLAGDFFKGKQLVGEQLRKVLNNAVRLASCGVNQEAAEGTEWGGGRGVFSYYLLSGLNGFADLSGDGTIQFNELETFLDSSFTNDRYLQQLKHKQHPVLDGNPGFVLSANNKAAYAVYRSSLTPTTTANQLPAGLSIFQNEGTPPIDYFFSQIDGVPVENYIELSVLKHVTDTTLSLQFIDACMQYADSAQKSYLSLMQEHIGQPDEAYWRNELMTFKQINRLGSLDSLKLLRQQLQNNKSLMARFNERLIQLIQGRAQDMINAYMQGDEAELEKRQYYSTGQRNYQDFVTLLNLALRVMPQDHHLYKILNVDRTYLSGVIARINMATLANQDSLLKVAFYNTRQALQLEPYAAYIHNELGNLFLHTKKLDSAAYQFDFANDLSPAWAIPWSNKIKLNIMRKNWAKAAEAFAKANSLQPGLSYTLMNMGLVMEHEQNWLAAESYYLRAINLNPIHFFPFERLGNVYLNTGSYANADYYFAQAKKMKADFTVEDSYFDFGIELGGPPRIPDEHDQPAPNAIEYLTGLEQQFPAIHLSDHYKAKQLYHTGPWQQAKELLLQSIDEHVDDSTFRKLIETLAVDSAAKIKDSFFVERLLHYQYGQLDDRYMLAGLYEQKGFFDDAIVQYKTIAGMEDSMQMAQAKFTGFPFEFGRDNLPDYYDESIILERFEKPLPMGGAIKLARLYERLNKLSLAEETLLNQQRRNLAAGLVRQRFADANKPEIFYLIAGHNYNYYFLNVKRKLEVELYNFYKRITNRYPRDYEWQEKAGLFLYHSLLPAYNQMSVQEYTGFTEALERYDYPWTGQGDVLVKEDTLGFTLPGTEEKITMIATVYNPVDEALNYLEKSVKLSGDEQPRNEILEALANVNSWKGNFDKAAQLIRMELNQQPHNASLRNRLIDFSIQNARFTDVLKNLDTLYYHDQLKHDQLLTLADYRMYSGNLDSAVLILNTFKPTGKLDEIRLAHRYAMLQLLQKDKAAALKYLAKSSSSFNIDETTATWQDDELNSQLKGEQLFHLYSTARLNALLKNDKKALATLKQALDAGLNYAGLLEQDEAWNSLRKTKKWKALLGRYTFSETSRTQQTSPLQYYIPRYEDQYLFH